MKLVLLALSFLITGSLFAQTPQFTDPANLRGERVKPRDGRELPIDSGVLGLQQLLRKLNTRASILNIVAHPDDEDGGMLTLYARGLGARVTDLSLTRGEGGQNAMTGDFEDALGLLRTQELLANDRYTGVDQLFGTEVDFGFSKTKEEAFAKWTHDRVLYDAVRAIRLVRPLVITATFIGGVTDGHGQHQVSGQIAQEAFVAAADPKIFPDMIAEGILPWQALRVYARVPFADINAKGVFDYATGQYVAPHFVNYVTGKLSTTKPPTDVVVPEGTPDPLFTAAAANPSDLPSDAPGTPSTPLSYAQFSRIGLFLQRSQIGKNTRLPTAGMYDSGYTLYGSALCADHNPIKNCLADRSAKRAAEGPATTQVPRGLSLGSHAPSQDLGFSPQGMLSSKEPNFFTGIDTSILSLREYHTVPTDLLAKLAGAIDTAAKNLDPAHPEAIAPTLAEALKIDDELIRFAEESKADPIERATALHELSIKRVQLNDALALALGLTLDASAPTENLITDASITVTETLAKASPQDLHVGPLFIEQEGRSQGDSEHDSLIPQELSSEPLKKVWELHKAPLTKITRPYFSRHNIEQPVYDLLDPNLRNAPATPYPLIAWASIAYNETSILVGRVVHDAAQPVSLVPPISLSFSSHAQALPSPSSSLIVTTIYSPPDPVPNLEQMDAPLRWKRSTLSSSANLAGHQTIEFQVPPDHREAVTLHDSVKILSGQTITEGYRPIGYGDLPRTNYYTPATTRIVPVDLQLPTHHTIAYLPGTGDAVPEALASINLTPTILTVADLTPNTLAKYDTVILGVRTYNAHPDLHGAPTAALLDYARNGGNVVVQYQTPEFTAADAPYPLSLGSNEKVVDETAPVVLLSPGTIRSHDASTSALASPGTIRSHDASTSGLASPGMTRSHDAPTSALASPGTTRSQDAPTSALASPGTIRSHDAPTSALASPGTTRSHDAPTSALASPGTTRSQDAPTSALASPGTIRSHDAPTSALASPGTIRYPKASALGITEKGGGALAPGYALLTTPNKITPADFDNWIEERGHGFLATWDDHYTALTETHDPGGPETAPQLPQRGGLITTPLGKGRWTYVAFALYRQLPEAVPGAYRLFLNLLNP